MNTIRKALLPSGLALAFLLFLGTVGSTQKASAADLLDVCGPDHVAVGSQAAYWIVLENDEDDDDIGAEVNGLGSIVGQLDGTSFIDLLDASTDEIGDLDVAEIGDFTPGLVNGLNDYGFDDGYGWGCTGDGEGDDAGDLIGYEGIALVIVECDDVDTYTVSFFSENDDEINGSIEVDCVGGSDEAVITARPTSVEITPSFANVAHSLITVTLTDDEGEPSFPGENVVFFTDRCAIETSAINDASEYAAVFPLYRDLNALAPITAREVELDDSSTTAPDSNRQQDEVLAYQIANGNTVATAILHCDPIHAPGVTPGVATITAVVDVDDANQGDDDLVVKTTVTVVGPPAANGVTVTASPATLLCGEKATISVDVKDSIGQPVSDHTLIEAVTNAGGVLGGTGAVIGFGGPVVPVSSTIAETFGGKATFYLLTSTAHVGKYEVVVTTGGGGGVTGQLYGSHGYDYSDLYSYYHDTVNVLGGLFTTAPISVQVTVECTVPAAPAPAAPTTTGPATGQGIRPPSTGDAGLATSESSFSLTLIAGAAVAAIVAVGITMKAAYSKDV